MRALVAVMMLSACAAAEDNPAGQQPIAGRWSLRQALADAIAPPGYQPNGGPAASPEAIAQAQAIQGAYQPDVARQQAGQQSVMVSQMTIYGGRINVPSGIGFGSTDWREHGGVVTATVAECESTPIRLQRADKAGGTTVYATRINGIVYVGPFASAARRLADEPEETRRQEHHTCASICDRFWARSWGKCSQFKNLTGIAPWGTRAGKPKQNQRLS